MNGYNNISLSPFKNVKSTAPKFYYTLQISKKHAILAIILKIEEVTEFPEVC